MGEALRNVAVLMWALCAVSTNAHAEPNVTVISEEALDNQPTIVYGASKKSATESDEAVVEQPAGGDNPLGNPIVGNDNSVSPQAAQVPAETVSGKGEPLDLVNESSPQNPPISAAESPEKVNEQIQNTLYESGGRIYDVQSYPEKDINKISEPNIQPTINNYPSY